MRSTTDPARLRRLPAPLTPLRRTHETSVSAPVAPHRRRPVPSPAPRRARRHDVHNDRIGDQSHRSGRRCERDRRPRAVRQRVSGDRAFRRPVHDSRHARGRPVHRLGAVNRLRAPLGGQHLPDARRHDRRPAHAHPRRRHPRRGDGHRHGRHDQRRSHGCGHDGAAPSPRSASDHLAHDRRLHAPHAAGVRQLLRGAGQPAHSGWDGTMARPKASRSPRSRRTRALACR